MPLPGPISHCITNKLQIVVIYLAPPLRQRFLSYGVRDSSEDIKGHHPREPPKYRPPPSKFELAASAPFTPFLPLLDRLALLRVPHSWFKHFYILSVLSAFFWSFQFLTHGPAARALTQETIPDTLSFDPALCFFFVHSLRRLYETVAFDKQSSSTMWIGHYLLGLLHYAGANAALWAEAGTRGLPAGIVQQGYTLMLVVLMAKFSISQYRIHRYLFHLPSGKRLGVPTDGVFGRILCPHYANEIGIYVCLAMLARKNGFVNWTMACVLTFVATNLTVSAKVTHEKYREKFGDESVRRKVLWAASCWVGREGLTVTTVQ
jgi:3-oxo-5-alpha-steroid 4-dehydrogenase 3